MIDKHIAVDMDDVVTDFVGGLKQAVWIEHGVVITDEQLAECGWNLHPLLDPIIGYSWWTWLRDREWLWANFPAVPGAIGGLERMSRDGYFIELITSKPDWARHNVWKWLGKWRPNFDRVTIVGPKDCKADFTHAAVLIDDKPENIEHFANSSRAGILFTRPHNSRIDDATQPYSYWRADTWQDVLTLVPEIIQLKGTPHGR